MNGDAGLSLHHRQDFARVQRMIYDHAGINLNDSKEQMVYSRLARRLRSLGIGSFAAYLDLLNATPSRNGSISSMR